MKNQLSLPKPCKTVKWKRAGGIKPGKFKQPQIILLLREGRSKASAVEQAA